MAAVPPRFLVALAGLVLATTVSAQSPCATLIDLNSGTTGSSCRKLTCAFGGSLLFFGRATSGWGLYRSSPSGQVQRLATPGNVASGMMPCHTAQGARVFFVGTDSTAGGELWSTDGTPAGTKRLSDVRPGPLGAYFAYFTPFGQRMIFTSYDFKLGWEPFVTDGTPAGTFRLGDFYPGSPGSDPRDFAAAGDKVLFTARTATHGRELWVTDGTKVGTKMINIGGTTVSDPKELTRFGNRVVFNALGPSGGREPWISDGTASGTKRLADIRPGASSSNPYHFAVMRDRIYFAAIDGTHGNEVWSSDGTTQGTKLLKDLNPGNASSDPFYLTVCSDKLYFSAGSGGISRLKPHVSDGTAAGTLRLKDVRMASSGPDVNYYVASNGLVFFAAFDHRGHEMWVTNGTPAGTRFLKDIRAGAYSGSPNEITAVGAGVCFQASSDNEGVELWFSDGTTNGTAIVCDFVTGTGGSYPKNLTVCGGRLFYTATNSATGDEPRWLKRPGASVASIPGASLPSRPELFVRDTRSPVLGAAFELVSRGPANHHGFLVLGLPTALPLPAVPGLLAQGADWVSGLSPNAILLTSAAGREVRFAVTLPNSSALDGVNANVQAWWLPTPGPLLFQVSNGLRLTMGTGRPR